MSEKKLGRPTEYKEEYDKLTYKFCLLGATDKDLAKFFEVSESTINKWKIDRPSFSESIKKGKEEADAKVAQSLFKRATGYKHKDVDIKMYEGQVIQTPIIKHYPPDATSAIFWLKNRQPKKWRDKQELDIETKDSSIKVEIVKPNESNDSISK